LVHGQNSLKKAHELKTKELIILGIAPSGEDCPFDTEVWGINDVCTLPQYMGKHFDKLVVTDPLGGHVISQEWMDNVKSYGIPVISYREYADEQYPLDEIIEEFLPDGDDTFFMYSTPARAMALAIYWGYTKIRLYGIDQCSHHYIPLKGCVEYWIGRAHERGITVEVQKQSCLMSVVRPCDTEGWVVKIK